MTTFDGIRSGGAKLGVVVVAGGSGTRLGLGRPKALVTVVSRTILEHSLDAVLGLDRDIQIVVVAPAADLEESRRLSAAAAGGLDVSVVAGGATRQSSVAAGLRMLRDSVQVVLVHDAARAFTPTEQFERVVAEVESSGHGVIPVRPVTDTIKQVVAGDLRDLDRDLLVAVQTPQGFPRAELVAAYLGADAEYTDDAALFAAAGNRVTTVAGDVLAFKITTASDLRQARELVADRGDGITMRLPRTGIGIDVHAFDDTAELWLGGVHWPGQPGLAGHSDGDAISHAVCDALLSASGLGDIGSRFGTDDERYAGAHGEVFLRATAELVAEAGWSIGNVAVQVVAARPKLAPRRSEIEGLLSGILDAPVSVSATTSDGLGFTGRSEGVAAVATALVLPRP